MIGPYRQLFAIRRASTFVLAGFVARLAHVTTTLGIVFLVSASTGSYSAAGWVAAAYAFTYAVVSPFLSRLADRYRQRPVLLGGAVVNTVLRCLFLGAVLLRVPPWGLAGLAVLVGGTMPAVGAMVRARWRNLVLTSGLLNTALSFESVVDDLIMVIGPVAIAAVVQWVGPAGAMGLITVFGAVGQFVLAAQRATEPSVVRTGPHRRATALLAGGLPLLATVFIGVGATESVITIATVAFTAEHRAPLLAGGILAVFGLGSVVAGLWYGTRTWRSSAERRLAASLGIYTIAMLVFLVTNSIPMLFTAAALAGLASAPTFTSGYSVVIGRVPEHLLTEGITILTSATGIGIALGSAVGGKVRRLARLTCRVHVRDLLCRRRSGRTTTDQNGGSIMTT